MTRRFQKGHVWRKKGGSAWYIRYSTDAVIEGRIRRVQKNERLCDVDRVHSSATCKAVRTLAAKVMERVNHGVRDADMSVTEFWEKKYLPFINENKKPSTVNGYKQIWKQHLVNHFAGHTLQGYRTPNGSQFLLLLTKTCGQRTINHIRSLASGIFSHALNLGYVDSNPWSGVKILGKVRPPKPTAFYTLEQVENAISALADRPDAQAFVALSFFCALRPSETIALEWNDIELNPDGTGFVHIRRAVVRGVLGTTKTPESVASIPLVPQAAVFVALWKQKTEAWKAEEQKMGKQTEGTRWVFPNENGRPMDVREFARNVLRPAFEKAEIPWLSVYALRRGAATEIVRLTNGNAQAAAALLRHKNMAVAFAHYVKQTQHSLNEGLKALGAAATAVSNK